MSSTHPLLLEIVELYYVLATGQYDITFCWLPSHVGIVGNTMADAAAKAALNKSVTPLLIPYSDLKPLIRSYIRDLMQKKWDTQVGINKLHEITPNIGYTYLGCQSRFEEVIMRRCRICHSRYIHEYILNGEDPPFCIPCDERITVNHVLLDCVDFSITRDKYFKVSSLKDLFSINARLIIDFLKEIELLHKF